MKLFVDDTRKGPAGWLVRRSPLVSMSEVKAATHLSLDHDFDGMKTTGLDLLKEMAETNSWPAMSLRVHSGNVEGAKAMKAFIATHAPAHLRRLSPSPYTAASKRLSKTLATKHY